MRPSLHLGPAQLVIGLLAPLALIACSTDTDSADTGAFDFGQVDTQVDLGDVTFDAPEPDECVQVERVTAIRSRSAPGGRQLHLSLTNRHGEALNAGFVSCLDLEDASLGPLPVVHSVAPTEPGATLIVARWTPEEAEASRAFIDDFVSQRPAEERIAVWAWSDQLIQVVGATTDRQRLSNRLDAVWRADDASPRSADDVAFEAAEAWERLSADALMGPRTIVFVASELSLEGTPDLDRDYVTDFWVLYEDLGRRQFPGATGDDLEDSAAEISATIDTVYDAGLSVLAFCDDGGSLDLSLSVAGDEVRRLRFGDAAQEHIGSDCDLQRIVNTAPPEVMRFEISFTEGERATFDQLAVDRDSETVWTGSVQLDGDEGATAFEGTFRGRSSLACERKSMSLNLDGADARHALEDSGTDEFFLVSMCLDNRYVNQLTADRLMAEIGVWELQIGTAEVRLDGVSRGVYLFVEEVDQELRNDRSQLRAVVRRRTDIDDKPADVNYAFDGDRAGALERYEAFLASFDGLAGDALVSALRASMDIEQYLRWVALMTLLENGDYVDEVYFIAEEASNADHEIADYYTIQGWDPDDLFSDCHHNGRFAIEDPNGLLYCTESLLDHRIFADATVYALYVDVLDELIAEMTVERFTAQADATRDELLGWFAVAEIREAMVELLTINSDAIDEAVAADEITAASLALVDSFAASRTGLLEAIDAYRAN